MAPLVSTIIATYNRAGLVCEAIESALAQTYPALEILVVDDGSEDDTRDRIARRFGGPGGERDRRVRVLHQDNAGPSVARNLGVAQARGELIAFLDSDDAWAPGKIERQVILLQREPGLAYAYTRCGEMEPDGARTGRIYGRTGAGHTGWNFPAVLQGSPVILPALMLWRRVFERIGGFDTRIDIGEDTSFLLRLAMDHRGGYLPETLAWVRCHPGRKTLEDRSAGKNHRSRVYLLTRLLTEMGPEHALRRMVAGRLVSAHIARTVSRGRDRAWPGFCAILLEDAGELREHVGDPELAGFVAGSLFGWLRGARDRSAIGPAEFAGWVEALRRQLASQPAIQPAIQPIWQSHLHAALAWHAMRSREIAMARYVAPRALRDPRAMAAVVRAEGQRLAEPRLVGVRQRLGWRGVQPP